MKRNWLVLGFILICSTWAHAQSDGPLTGLKWGLSASIQDNQFGVMVPIFLSDCFQLSPAFELKLAQKIGTDIGIGLVSRHYLWNHGKLSPYWGLRAGIITFIGDNTSFSPDIIAGGSFGLEYFLSRGFSIGLEPQLNFVFSGKESQRVGNPGKMNANTATVVLVNIYL